MAYDYFELQKRREAKQAAERKKRHFIGRLLIWLWFLLSLLILGFLTLVVLSLSRSNQSLGFSVLTVITALFLFGAMLIHKTYFYDEEED